MAAPDPLRACEEQLLADPVSLATLRVYGDLLVANGDVRGGLIALHDAMERSQWNVRRVMSPVPGAGDVNRAYRDPEYLELVAAERHYFESHRAQFMEGLERFLPFVHLEWRLGFVHGVRFVSSERYRRMRNIGGRGMTWPEILYAVLNAPSCRYLAHMEFRLADAADGLVGLEPRDGTPYPPVSLSIRLSEPRDAPPHPNLLTACRVFPQLESVSWRGLGIRFEPVPSTLRTLALTELGPELDESLPRLMARTLPTLERLVFGKLSPPSVFDRLFEGTFAPRLRALTLLLARNAEAVVCADLMDSPLLDSLRDLSLIGVLHDEEMAILEQRQHRFHHLHEFYVDTGAATARARQLVANWRAANGRAAPPSTRPRGQMIGETFERYRALHEISWARPLDD